jgi:hypothetical protein
MRFRGSSAPSARATAPPGALKSTGSGVVVTGADDGRRLLVERIASSPVVSKSARLRDLLLYLCDRVRDGQVAEIHEQEVGHHVFGRPVDYDASVDNIVRVHASLLRKRLADYSSKDGAREPLVIEIPKGNYAPVFRRRTIDAAAATTRFGSPRLVPAWVLGGLGAAVVLFACSTAWLLIRTRSAEGGVGLDMAARPTVHLLWSQVIRADRQTDIVIDDASIGLYQELTKHRISLNDYFDRSYLLRLPETAQAASLDRETAASVITRRHASNQAVTLLWKLFQVSESEHGHPNVQFARDYSFHSLKTNNVILLGNRQSNPWVEPYEGRLGLRWVYDKELDSSYPVDSWSDDSERAKFHPNGQAGGIREGYCAVSLLSNLGATGNALLISATGGSTMATCSEFLTDEQALTGLYRKLARPADGPFPQFEALLRITGRSTQPRDMSILIARAPRA